MYVVVELSINRKRWKNNKVGGLASMNSNLGRI